MRDWADLDNCLDQWYSCVSPQRDGMKCTEPVSYVEGRGLVACLPETEGAGEQCLWDCI